MCVSVSVSVSLPSDLNYKYRSPHDFFFPVMLGVRISSMTSVIKSRTHFC